MDCINDGILADFLKNHRAEVIDVCITECNEKTFVDDICAESYDEGHQPQLVIDALELSMICSECFNCLNMVTYSG